MSRRPRISYRDLARSAPGEGESTSAPEQGAGSPPEQHDRPAAAQPQHPSAAPASARSPEPAVANMSGREGAPDFAMPVLDTIERSAPAPVRRTTSATTRFRDRVRAREGIVELLVFRVAGELFAVELSAVEEAMDCPPSRALPEMPASMRGVFMLRQAPVALYAPNSLLGLEPHEAQTVLVFRPGANGRRTALAIDDVDDVLVHDLAALRDAPGTDAADGILVGVARRGRDLIGLLDAEALLAACRSDTVLETV